MRAINHCIAHMRHAGTYTVKYADMYSKKILQYLNLSFIFKDF
jgi:hypothetical protein